MKSNIIANALGRLWNILSVFLFVPFYIRYLGIEAYGVIGFYAVIQGTLIIADAGLSATLNRELARRSALNEGTRGMRDLVRTIEAIYWSIAVLMGLILYSFVGTLAEKWGNLQGVPGVTMSRALQLMAWAVVLQFPASLYQGGLLGLQRQVLSNGLQIAWSAIRNGGVILALLWLGPTLGVFFGWQLVCNLAYSILTAVYLWRSIPQDPVQPGQSFRLTAIRGVWRYAAGMAAMALLSAILMQIDKIVVIRLLPLKEFSFYSVATVISQAPVLVVGPIAIAVYPQLTSLAAKGATESLGRLYHRACQLVAVLLVPAGVMICLFAGELIRWWTRSPEVAQNAGPIATWFVVGSTALALQVIPYQLALANNYVKLNLVIGLTSLLFIYPLLTFLVGRFGGVGGGITWTVLNLSVLVPYIALLHRKFLPGSTRIWLQNSLGIPLIISIITGLISRHFISIFSSQNMRLLGIALATLVAVIVSSAAIPGFAAFILLRLGFPLTERPHD